MYISIQKFSFPAYTPNLGRWARRGGGGGNFASPPVGVPLITQKWQKR